MKPKRMQLRRTKGYRKPEGAVVVSRPSKWGNPFPLNGDGRDAGVRQFAVDQYELWLRSTTMGRLIASDALLELAGKDLACWCPLDEPCHADVLLRVANPQRKRS